MHTFLRLLPLAIVSLSSPLNDYAPRAIRPRDANIVNTTSGWYIGHCSPHYDHVTEYLGIRYGEPPINDLRFAAPVAYTSNEVVEASKQPDDCPYVAQPWGSLPGESWSHALRIMAQESADGYNAMSEDCLKLNVWAPHRNSTPKAVMVFVYGGGFERGSINNPDYNGAHLAANQDVIVVTFNFRVNIFGLANAPGTDTNVALRDMRLAVEWVRDNIAAFGGDVNRITLFGQSQGAYFISCYPYAYPDDTIASAFIQQSGSAFAPLTESLPVKADTWRTASASVGCNQSSDAEILACMRAQNVSTVLAAWASVPATATLHQFPFGPVVDNELIFENYTAKTIAGELAQKPTLIGSNTNEAGFYVLRFASNNTNTLSQSAQDSVNYGDVICPISREASLKSALFASSINTSTTNTSSPNNHNLSTSMATPALFRYTYSGDYPNLRLYPGSGAYHTSETSIIFGTMEELSGDPNTEVEEKVSRYMQGAWARLAKDPVEGLRGLGWPSYGPGLEGGETVVRLGRGNEVVASFGGAGEVDGGIC